MALPKEINYSMKPSPLPEGTECISVVAQPSNGNSFTNGSQIQFDLLSRGYLVPDSMYIRYAVTFTGATTPPEIKGTPAYTMFSRLETYCGGSTLESITNYGQVCNFLINCRMNYAQKQGLAAGLGIYGSNATGNVTDVTELNGRLTAIGANTLTLSAPLNCILANCDHLFPLKFVAGCRIQLTVDSLASIFSVSAANVTNFLVSNVELCYDIIDFPSSVDDAVMSMADERGRIMLKTSSFVNAGQTIGASAVGSYELIYNYRLLSIKSLYAILGGTHANSVNGFYDSLDVTSGNGRYQFQISGKQYPNLPLDTLRNKSAVIMELAQSFSPVQNLLNTNFSITPPEFNYTNTATTTTYIPAKFFIGVNTEKLSSNQVLLSGVSTMNSPISLRIDIGTATTNAQVAYVIANYDAIFEIDVVNKQLTLIN